MEPSRDDKTIFLINLISFHEHASEETRTVAREACERLGEECGGKKAGILLWNVAPNLDLRKNVHLVEVALFESDDALQAFRNHPAHMKFAAVLRGAADWKIGKIPGSFLSKFFQPGIGIF